MLSLLSTCVHSSLLRIIFSTPFAVLTYLLIWYVPPFEEGKVIWYLVFYCLFQSMQTVSTAFWAHVFYFIYFICFLSTDVNLSNVVVSYICSASMCHIQPSPCSSAGTRKSGTLLQPTVRHHPVQINWFHWCFVIRVLTVSSCVCSQGWWWRCWAQCWALQSRGR